jgi:hypothetical protein
MIAWLREYRRWRLMNAGVRKAIHMANWREPMPWRSMLALLIGSAIAVAAIYLMTPAIAAERAPTDWEAVLIRCLNEGVMELDGEVWSCRNTGAPVGGIGQ